MLRNESNNTETSDAGDSWSDENASSHDWCELHTLPTITVMTAVNTELAPSLHLRIISLVLFLTRSESPKHPLPLLWPQEPLGVVTLLAFRNWFWTKHMRVGRRVGRVGGSVSSALETVSGIQTLANLARFIF